MCLRHKHCHLIRLHFACETVDHFAAIDFTRGVIAKIDAFMNWKLESAPMRMIGLILGLVLASSAAVHAETILVPIKGASIAHDDVTNQDCIDVKLTPDGQHNLAVFTRNRVGRTIHIRADGVMLASPTVMNPIEGDALRLSPGVSGFGGMPAQEIVNRLSTGGTIDVSDDK